MNLEEILTAKFWISIIKGIIYKEKKKICLGLQSTYPKTCYHNVLYTFKNKRYYSLNTRLLNIAAQKTQYFLQQWH